MPESHLSLMEWTRDSRNREIVPIYRQRILHSEKMSVEGELDVCVKEFAQLYVHSK